MFEELYHFVIIEIPYLSNRYYNLSSGQIGYSLFLLFFSFNSLNFYRADNLVFTCFAAAKIRPRFHFPARILQTHNLSAGWMHEKKNQI